MSKQQQTQTEGQIMKDLVQYISEALVDKPDEVKVHVVEGENSIILELKVAADDVGKVIGKGGQTAKKKAASDKKTGNIVADNDHTAS